MIKNFLIFVLIAGSFSSCTVLKEYEKININDPDMVLQDKKVDRNVTTMHSYREAAAGANGGKTGGGCGCN
ncbi:DUF4266 domain-containing protein [Maribacter arcticus]|uniref:DUF4266 domain-containing protein n=1 Tax=Maribacter arcticus TaxID=561365 RepID=A0A1T5CEK2_9FLAO|nr:DUF4266 domain-containing protein [Maribacter arcticus]SKB57897.1 protein of unknown function [Maribacter arcticus]|tara:strand:+ start:195 stop:407 length:213 start_codon:yes stop_codon:yes gene_type:complete